MLDRSDWNQAVAHLLAASLEIELTEAHWTVINAARDFYERTHSSPEMRPLVKTVRAQAAELDSLALLSLFPDPAGRASPAKLVALIGGLPRPTNCL